MPKLHETIALLEGKKTRAEKALTEAHHGWKAEAISGISRRYTPKDEAGEKLPAEIKNVQVDVRKVIRGIRETLIQYMDIVATQETANTHAAGSVVVNGREIVGPLPVGVLLFLEKRLADLRTFIGSLPTLPTDREWTWDGNRNCYATAPVQSTRTQKVPEVIVKYPATEQHPAQTELFAKDVTVGTWDVISFSSAISVQAKESAMAKIEALADAVKAARTRANSEEAVAVKIGETIVDYVFEDLLRSAV